MDLYFFPLLSQIGKNEIPKSDLANYFIPAIFNKLKSICSARLFLSFSSYVTT